MIRPPRIHWLGGVQTARGERLADWPCCATGERCYRLAERDEGTYFIERVNCPSCRRVMLRSVDDALRMKAQWLVSA